MYNVDIYVRTDLRTSSGKKVQNGKMASQSAHALMAGFLSLFNKQSDSLELKKENVNLLNAFINKEVNLNFIPVKSLEEIENAKSLYKERAFVIEDQGRTSFKEPTVTTMSVMPEGFDYELNTDCRSESGEVYNCKQVLVINKDEIKDKWEMFNVVSLCSLQFLIDIAQTKGDYSISLQHKGLKAWIEGAFAKITLKPSTKTIEELKETALKADTFVSIYKENDVIKCVSFGADFVEKIDEYTKEGFSLA